MMVLISAHLIIPVAGTACFCIATTIVWMRLNLFLHILICSSSPFLSQVSMGLGLEVLPVHDEQETLQIIKDCPLHLMNFSVDWVGRPGVPLTEQTRIHTMAEKVHVVQTLLKWAQIVFHILIVWIRFPSHILIVRFFLGWVYFPLGAPKQGHVQCRLQPPSKVHQEDAGHDWGPCHARTSDRGSETWVSICAVHLVGICPVQ